MKDLVIVIISARPEQYHKVVKAKLGVLNHSQVVPMDMDAGRIGAAQGQGRYHSNMEHPKAQGLAKASPA